MGALVRVALRVSTEQENYGKPDEASVARVKAVYNELALEQKFLDYEQVMVELGRCMWAALLRTCANHVPHRLHYTAVQCTSKLNGVPLV